ncbi:MAG: hypothetical protein KDA60_15100, partial [Planctomycetales bacterium]|nr:hypothetical protein [Planctomycetales bacterium]
YYRWATVESKRICSGQVNPTNLEETLEQHAFFLEQAPYALTISPLDCESLNVMFGFDLTYRGNHNELVAEALGITPAFEGMLEMPGATTVSYEPTLQFALDEDCRTQIRMSLETRTSAYHVRTGDFPEEQISVYLTARRYGSLRAGDGETFVGEMKKLFRLCEEITDNYVVEQVLRPLQQTIATK